MKTAKASTDVMKGVMVLKVKSDGSAHVKKVSNYFHYMKSSKTIALIIIR